MTTTIATLQAIISADDSPFRSGLAGVRSALDQLGGAIGAVGITGMFGKAISEAADQQTALTKLKAVYISMNPTIEAAKAIQGHWNTVTKISGDMVADWQKGLKSAEKTVESLHAKQAAGIALSKAEAASLAHAQQSVAAYSQSLAGATTTHKVWSDGMGQATKAIGISFDDLVKQAADLQNVTIFSDKQVMEVQRLLLTFGNLKGDMLPKVTALALDLSTTFDQDLKTSAIELGKALNDPINGMATLHRIGITWSAAQENVIKQLVRTNQLGKAQAMMYEIVQQQAGHSARAVGQTFAGQMAILNNTINDVFESFGSLLLPILTPVVQAFRDVARAVAGLDPVFKIAIGAVGAFLLATSPIVGALLPIIAPIAAIGAAVLLLDKAWKENFGNIRSTVSGLYAGIKPDLDKVSKAVDDFLKGFNDPKAGYTKMEIRAAVKMGGLDNLSQPDIGTKLMSGLSPIKGVLIEIKNKFDDVADSAHKLFSIAEFTLFDTLNKAAQAAGRLAVIAGVGLSLAADSARKLLSIAEFTLFNTLNDAAVAAGRLVFIVGFGVSGALAIANNFISIVAGAIKSELVNAINQIDPTRFGYLAAGIGLVGIVLTGAKIAEGVQAIAAALALLLGSAMFPVILGLGVIAAITLAATTNFMGFGDTLKKIHDWIYEAATALVQLGVILVVGIPMALNDARAAFENNIGKAVKFLEPLTNAIEGILKALQDIPGAATAALNAISGAISGDGAPGGGSGGGGRSGGHGGSGGGSVGGHAQMRAFGGPVSGGAPYIVGERGPELFVPSSSGAIVSNGKFGGGLSIGEIHLHGVQDPVKMFDAIQAEARRRNIRLGY